MDTIIKFVPLFIIIAVVFFWMGIFGSSIVNYKTQDGSEWRNCDPTPPNFSGICCRWFEEEQKWECRRHTGDKGFSEEEEAQVPWLEGIDPSTQEMEGNL
jgi:hypothetical protein